MTIDLEAFERTRRNAVERLLAERNAAGHWVGELSSSALSTATATVALALIDRANGTPDHRDLIADGLRWLAEHQNEDGGWGDTDRSVSNISTTMLCWAALGIADPPPAPGERPGVRVRSAEPHDNGERGHPRARSAARAERWLAERAGSLETAALVEAVMKRYGDDRTFSVPILTMCALAGRLGDPRKRETWRWVGQLPFELAALPMRLFGWLRLPVVSYALPALIAIGQVRDHHRPTRNPVARLVRRLTKRRTLAVLDRIQPTNGGFLEATPLTSFVTMSLAGAGHADHPVARGGACFLAASVRPDGSWPIDTNLTTWVTTLSVNALAGGSRLNEYLDEQERAAIRNWLLDQQYTSVHPYTNADPGGWAWTDLPGGVPDADDTSGALIALRKLASAPKGGPLSDERVDKATAAGVGWLASLQNRDGGIPTFCRGWGALPFDRSSQDISAHALRAAATAAHGFGSRASRRLLAYLLRTQRSDGSWTPLWFGNQHQRDDQNPTYGTARVLSGLCAAGDEAGEARARAARWLMGAQNGDGGWGAGPGTPSSVEETALAVEALAEAATAAPLAANPHAAIERGVAWLIHHTHEGTAFDPAPIGFYFAKLWYYEKLYPLIWTVAALERVGAYIKHTEQADAASASRT